MKQNVQQNRIPTTVR